MTPWQWRTDVPAVPGAPAVPEAVAGGRSSGLPGSRECPILRRGSMRRMLTQRRVRLRLWTTAGIVGIALAGGAPACQGPPEADRAATARAGAAGSAGRSGAGDGGGSDGSAGLPFASGAAGGSAGQGASAGQGGAPDSGDDCSPEGQNQYVYALMKSYYLWFDHTPTYSPEEIEAFESPQALLNAMRYAELDRWSSMSPLVERTVFYEEGQYVNFGWFLLWDGAGRLRIAFRDHGSSVAQAGLERGAEVVAINGEPLAQILDDGRWDSVWGPNEEGYALTFEVVDAGGGMREVTLEKSLVQMTTVHHTEVLETSFGTVGYLLFNRFLGISEAELRTAFEGFRGAGVDELVLDLRYNPGGLNGVARTLGSLVASPNVVGERFLLQDYNEQYPELDHELLFQDELSALGLSRLAIITSLNTASASELVINGLSPFVDVALVGERTYGKPVGADTWSHCDWAITPITHTSRNADEAGNFYGGFAPDCPIPDDFDHALGDPEEARLSAALYWLEHEACPPE